MARNVRFKLEGLKELEQALGQLPRATQRNVLRRVLEDAGEPIAQAARARAPRDVGNLIESIDVSPRLTRRQKARHQKVAGVEMHVGAGANPQAITQEFGTFSNAPQPFMRPAYDAEKVGSMNIIYHSLWGEIEKAAQRAARKAARLARKG